MSSRCFSRIIPPDLFERKSQSRSSREGGGGRPGGGVGRVRWPGRRTRPSSKGRNRLREMNSMSETKSEVREWRGDGATFSFDCGVGRPGVACGLSLSKHVDVDPNHIERDIIAVTEAQHREFPLVGGGWPLTSLTKYIVTHGFCGGPRDERRRAREVRRVKFKLGNKLDALETFRAEDAAVLKAGLGGAYVTVDDTGGATPARAATRRRSAPIPSRCFAPARANRAWHFCRGCAAARRSM